jgi:HK97 family phage portal protein
MAGLIQSVLSVMGFSRKSAVQSYDEIADRIDGGGWSNAESGELVNRHTALRVSAVLACVKVIADGCATPSLNIYRQLPGNKRELAVDVPQFRLLNRRPNEWQTSFEFRRTMTLHAALCGDALAFKVRNGKRVLELIPVQPGNYEIVHNERYKVSFRCWDKFGLIGEFGSEDVLHLPGLRWAEIKSLDVLNLAREAIGLSISAEKSQAQLHRNGGQPGGLLSTPQALTSDIVARIKDNWKEFSNKNRSGTAVLDNDFKFTPLSMKSIDAQHLETRRFQVEEVCRIFGVFPIMVGHSDKSATFASSEAFFSAHVKHTLAPWHESWMQRLDEFVLDGSGPLYAAFDVGYLTEGSMKDRGEFIRTLRETGVLSQNEARELVGLDPVAGGDKFIQALNMTDPGAASVEDEDEGTTDGQS